MNSLLPVQTVLNIPSPAPFPGSRCLQWSEDGQLFFMLKSCVYIMTPDPGINFGASTVLKFALKDTAQKDKSNPLGWFRTMIQTGDKTTAYRWTDQSTDWATKSVGAIDICVCAIALSPTNIVEDAGCILATLSTNMDLYLYSATKNSLTGEWTNVFDVTTFLTETCITPDVDKEKAILNAQTTCIAWTKQADFAISPSLPLNGSILICGNRGGSLVFLRYTTKTTMEHILTFPLSIWITRIACTSWIALGSGTCEGYVAYATEDGAIGLVQLKQILTHTTPTSNLDYSIELTCQESTSMLCDADTSLVTAMEWIEIPARTHILAYHKAGVLHFWSPQSVIGWSGHRHLTLVNQEISIGSSPLHPASGIQYLPRQDILIITLFDGSFHVVHNVSIEPSWTPARDSSLSSRQLSLAARAVFKRSAAESMGHSDVNTTAGFICYNDSGDVMWLHEASNTSNFSYKHDARHNSVFIVAQLWDDTNDEALLGNLKGIMEDPTGEAPVAQLRSTFYRLRQPEVLQRLHLQLLGVLKLPSIDHSIGITVLWNGPLTPPARKEMRASLTTHLFGWSSLVSLRMRLSLADLAWKLTDDVQRRNDYGLCAQELLNTIGHRNLRTIIKHLLAEVDVLSVEDVPFIHRMVIQSLLPGSPLDVTLEGQRLKAAFQPLLPIEIQSQMDAGVDETCPACSVEIPLGDITSAVCSKGHTWARCSITTLIISTTQVRTCIGCTRKAFLPLSALDSVEMLPPAAQGWVVQELLEAVHRCLFCGNSFIRVL
ncbi:putative zinc-finger of transcription factor IIIC complex-domain-containing protein [Mycena floridula]|nr:putative zinc-finger of transcription factor IIIC complex-domain-containing protein [Mycena floridula]